MTLLLMIFSHVVQFIISRKVEVEEAQKREFLTKKILVDDRCHKLW